MRAAVRAASADPKPLVKIELPSYTLCSDKYVHSHGDLTVAVRIRMKPMGRKHRHYYRIVAIDGRQPNDGRVIEELGTYDPHNADNDKNVTVNADRVRYWQSVGAKASDKVTVLLNKVLAKSAAAAPPPAEGEKKG